MTDLSVPVLPDYQGGCISNVVPELIKSVLGQKAADWVPSSVEGASQIVLLVLDGLGWEQLQERTHLAPTLSAFEGGSITAVAPTTTVTCLTSIVTGRPPSVHGLLGYRLAVEGGILDALKWTTSAGDAIETVVPEQFQVHPSFAANEVPVITRQHVLGSGFTRAHLQGARLTGYATPSSLPVEVWRSLRSGEKFTYAYYGGVDTVAHLHGFGEHYDAELYTVDRLMRDLIAGLPKGAALVVTADHGQVEVRGRTLDIDVEVIDLCAGFSGEGRFRWLHAKPDQHDELVKLCKERYSELAWVVTREEMEEQGWFGGKLSPEHASRLGDVALVAHQPVAFHDPTNDGERHMQCRHGSLTSAEVFVPLLAHKA